MKGESLWEMYCEHWIFTFELSLSIVHTIIQFCYSLLMEVPSSWMETWKPPDLISRRPWLFPLQPQCSHWLLDQILWQLDTNLGPSNMCLKGINISSDLKIHSITFLIWASTLVYLKPITIGTNDLDLLLPNIASGLFLRIILFILKNYFQ